MRLTESAATAGPLKSRSACLNTMLSASGVGIPLVFEVNRVAGWSVVPLEKEDGWYPV